MGMTDSVRGRGRRLRGGVSRRPRPGKRVRAASLTALATPLVLAASLASAPNGAVNAPVNGALTAVPSTAVAATGSPVSVIVREQPGAGNSAERALRAVGGTTGRRLGIIDGFAATVPAGQLAGLRRAPGVHSVTVDAPVELAGSEAASSASNPGSMYKIAQEITGAAEMWNDGITGRGVDVALIDSGVVPVDGLQTPGKVVYGPDLSSEAYDCTHSGCEPGPARYLDSYGHGTHLAGIIAGRDDLAPYSVQKGDREHFLGMAPDAGIVSVKVADAYGATDVSQVIAAIDWVVEHRRSEHMNIRVLNLSFGTDGVQDYQLDPLAYAAEVAWRRGIVVVVAAGNSGYGSDKLNNPAYDPYVIAVGGSDGKSTYSVHDDVIPPWSSTGDGTRNPDLVAPGTSVLSLRDPGSFIDTAHPGAQVGTRFFRGSGTSQAAAVVSGAAALLIQQRPAMSPDQVKALLMRTAQRLPAADTVAQGAGLLDLKRARDASTPTTTQRWPLSSGTGSLEAARGTHHFTVDGESLDGELDVTGRSWDGRSWSSGVLLEQVWTGGAWTGRSWSGGSWNGRSWSAAVSSEGSWLGRSWSGRSWSGRSWSGRSWSGRSWSGRSWSTTGWGESSGTAQP